MIYLERIVHWIARQMTQFENSNLNSEASMPAPVQEHAVDLQSMGLSPSDGVRFFSSFFLLFRWRPWRRALIVVHSWIIILIYLLY